jgi:hypothetical protein
VLARLDQLGLELRAHVRHDEHFGLTAVGPRVAVGVFARPRHEVLKSALSTQLKALLLDHAEGVVLLALLALPAGPGEAEVVYVCMNYEEFSGP